MTLCPSSSIIKYYMLSSIFSNIWAIHFNHCSVYHSTTSAYLISASYHLFQISDVFYHCILPTAYLFLCQYIPLSL